MSALISLAQALDAAWPAVIAAGLGTFVLGRRVLCYLRRRQILDLPNERSSHTLPTPRGGGLATTPIMALLFVLIGIRHHGVEALALGLGAFGLMALSWWDDRHSLPVLPRFASHAAAIGMYLAFLPADAQVFMGAVPVWLDRAITLICWVWFLNLYNFMDGIDGITGVQTASLGVGLAIMAGLGGPLALLPLGGVVGMVGLTFLLFNWHPARMFLGDSGSVPFGYVLGGLLVVLASHGHLAAAIILPGYYLADATITLGRRALAGEKIWQAHRKHFYQRAVQGGKRHDQVVMVILTGNLLLIGCAVLTMKGLVLTGSLLGAVIVAAMLALLQIWARGVKA